MFGDFKKLEEMKAKLNSVSPSFCMAKWMHVTIHLMNGHTHSCYLPQTHKIPLKEIAADPSALHNTEYKKLRRKEMLEGKRPTECGICWGVEDLPGNQVSDRHMRAVDSWTMPYFDKIKNSPWDANINPSYVEVSFSATCNFRCSYCSPHVSSRWMEEIKKFGPYSLTNSDHQNLGWLKNNGYMPLEEDHNPYIEAFWKWWPELVKTLMFFRITGGEPLLSKHTFKVLNWLTENPQPHLDLSINSNLGAPENYMRPFIETIGKVVENKKVGNFLLHTSLDTYGEQAEYIRNGLDFAYFEKNIHRYLQALPNSSIAFMCTFNNLSVVGFQRYLEWILDLRKQYQNPRRDIFLDIPHLMGPRHHSVKILPPEYRDKMKALIQWMEERQHPQAGIKEAEVDKMKRILAWMEAPNPEHWLRDSRRDFYLFFSEHDRRRGTNFLRSFPEMETFWNLCKSHVA